MLFPLEEGEIDELVREIAVAAGFETDRALEIAAVVCQGRLRSKTMARLRYLLAAVRS